MQGRAAPLWAPGRETTELLAWAVFIALASAALSLGKISGEAWIDAMTWATGLYMTSRVGAKIGQGIALRGEHGHEHAAPGDGEEVG